MVGAGFCVCMCVCCVCALMCLCLWCFTSLFHWVCVPVILSHLTQVRRLQAGVQVLEAGVDHVGHPDTGRRAAWVRVLSPSPSFPDNAVHFLYAYVPYYLPGGSWCLH